MKRMMGLAFVALMAMCVMVVGCTTVSSGNQAGLGSTPPSAQQLTPQQVVAIVCPPMQTALTQLQGIYDMQAAMGSATAAKASAGLAKAHPVISEACAFGASVSVANVQSFVTTALPALAQVAGTLPLSQRQMADVQTALLTAQLALGVYNVVQSQIAAGAALHEAGSSPAPSASVAVPAAASSVVK